MQRLIPPLVVAAIAFSTAILSGCGAAYDAIPPTDVAKAYSGFVEYERKCQEINERGAEARVVYEASKRMKVGDSETIRAAVTLDQTVQPEILLPRTDAVGEPVFVSCRLQARLTASKYEFEINDKGWIDRSFYAGDTARWVWFVTPKLGGNHELILLVRPIVRLREAGSESETDLAAEASVGAYTTRVEVAIPWSERPTVLMTQIASMLNVAVGLVKVLTALILAVLALLGALGLRRKARKRSDS